GPPGRTEGGCRQNRQRECMPAHCSHSRPPLDLREVKRPLLCPPPYTRVRPARYELSHRTAGQLIGGRGTAERPANMLFFGALPPPSRARRPGLSGGVVGAAGRQGPRRPRRCDRVHTPRRGGWDKTSPASKPGSRAGLPEFTRGKTAMNASKNRTAAIAI